MAPQIFFAFPQRFFLNIAHVRPIYFEQCSFNQGDYHANPRFSADHHLHRRCHRLVTGFGKAIVHIATAPIERIANACDVGGVLPAGRPRAAGMRRDSPSSSQPGSLVVAVRLPAPPDLSRRRFRSNVSQIDNKEITMRRQMVRRGRTHRCPDNFPYNLSTHRAPVTSSRIGHNLRATDDPQINGSRSARTPSGFPGRSNRKSS